LLEVLQRIRGEGKRSDTMRSRFTMRCVQQQRRRTAGPSPAKSSGVPTSRFGERTLGMPDSNMFVSRTLLVRYRRESGTV